jgi:hypothetical protein
MWLRNPEIALESAEVVLQLAETHGFHIWSAIGSCLRAAALIKTGVTDEGLTLIEQGMNTYRGLKTPPVFWPLLLHLCAGAYGAASRPEEGLRLLDEALVAESGSKSTGALATEFSVLKGDLMLASSSANVGDAEAIYRWALHNAQEADAPMVELRAAMRLSRLWSSQGRTEQARELLNEAYSKITEGFATPDLKETRAILVALSS